MKKNFSQEVMSRLEWPPKMTLSQASDELFDWFKNKFENGKYKTTS